MTTLAFPDSPTEHGRGPRVEGELKVSGQMLFSDDLPLPGLLWVAVVRSPYPHARILKVDTEDARKVPGVHAIITGADVAHLIFGRALMDVPILAHDKARFAGEMIAAVAAESKAAAEEAAASVQAEYDPLPAIFDAVEAMNDSAPAVHNEPWSYKGAGRGPNDGPKNLMGRVLVQRGSDIEAALAASDRVFEHTFKTQANHHGYLEAHSCTVSVEPGNQVRVWSCNKSPYRLREQLSAAFDIPVENFQMHSPAVGGDFGGKGSPMDIPLCLELSRRTGRPVRMTMRYTEELMAPAARHASTTTIRIGVTRDGAIQAMDAHAIFNSGAYGGFRPGVNFGGQMGTSYRIPAIRCMVDRVYTNQVPGGNQRAPGAPQLTFALESMIDFVAREMGMDPASFRRNNIVRQGESTPFGDHYVEVRSLETLDLAENSYRSAFPKDAPRSVRFGRGIAFYDRASHAPQRTSIRLLLLRDGIVEAQVPQMETGTGSHSVIRRVVAEGIGIPIDHVVVRYVGTAHLPYDSGVGGSRVTVSAAEAAHQGALRFREEALQQQGGGTLDLEALSRRGASVEIMYEVGVGQDTGGHAEAATSYCVQIAQVGVDVETGEVKLYEMLTAVDVADILEPMSHRSQIQGGVVMGIGYALTEDLGIEEGRVTAAHLGDYKLPSIADSAPLRVELLEGGKGVGSRNVKGIGELTNVPTAAAIANAVADAVGVRIDSLPITAEKVLNALRG